MSRSHLQQALFLAAWLLLAGLSAPGADPAGGPLPPFLPEIPAVTPYVSNLTPPAELSVDLAGKTLRPADYLAEESLSGTWKFSGLVNSEKPFPAEIDLDQGYEKPEFAETGWDEIAVPLDWYKKYPKFLNKDLPYVKGWYRKSFDLPQERSAGRVLLKFGVIGYEAKLFVNGQAIGEHHGDFTPWTVDITPAVKFGQKNVLALRVLSDFGPNLSPKIEKAKHAYGSQWSIGNVKGGLWQDAALLYRPQVYFQAAMISPLLAKKALRLDYRLINQSGAAKTLNLRGLVRPAAPGGTQAADADLGALTLQPGENSGTLELALTEPHPWTPADPYLYYLVLALTENGAPVAAQVERFGYRDFKRSGQSFLLNGERIYLYGENLSSVGFGGSGKPRDEERAQIAEKLQGFKALGYNLLRNPHMPIIPDVLELADEIGIMFFDEWAWSFTTEIDEPEFEKRNLAEIKEWVERDFNHACVAMWSCGNEVRHQDHPEVARQLDKQVVRVRELDYCGRPISSFSGLGSFESYGTTKLDTDVIDLHDYLCLSSPAWTNWEKVFAKHYTQAAEIYGENGRLDKPYIVWELVGFSWGAKSDPKFKVNDVAAYAEYVDKKTSWGSPNGIGFAGCLGLAAGLDPAQGLDAGKAKYGRRIIEYIRQNPAVQGFAPWFHGFNLKPAALWTQPILGGLRDETGLYLRNVFAGEKYSRQLFIVNNTDRELTGVKAAFSLADAAGAVEPVAEFELEPVAAWTKLEKTVELTVPAGITGDRQLRLILTAGGQELSRSFYDLFAQDRAALTAPLTPTRKLAVWKNEASAEGFSQLTKVLGELGIDFAPLGDFSHLEPYQALFIPPATAMPDLPDAQKVKLFAWVKAGGTLAQFEQSYTGQDLLGQTEAGCPNTFVDLVVPAHPIFKGLGREQFDTWQNSDRGHAITHGFIPFTLNVLAARGPFLGRGTTYGAVVEGKFGEGRFFASQLCALELWSADSAAATYLRNVLDYLLVQPQVSEYARAWIEPKAKTFAVAPERLVSIDLRPFANMGFADEVAEDHQGGWTDQGPENDFSMMPLGRQTLAGVALEIIDPAQNGGKGAIVLRGKAKPWLPEQTPPIPVNQKLGRIFFLQTAAWGGGGNRIGEYQINYADGSSASAPLVDGENIADWWQYGFISDAIPALVKANRQGKDVGLFLYAWENPRPEAEIASFVFKSDNVSIPILVAVTGEKSHPDPLIIEDASAADTKWSGLSDPERTNPASFAFVAGQTAPELVRPGRNAIRLEMPPIKERAQPVIFKGFAKDKLAGGKYDYLSFWVRADSSEMLRVVLPRQDWKDSREILLPLKKGPWRKVRLSLKDEMTAKDATWGLDQLRGELFFYRGAAAAADQVAAGRTPLVFYLDDVRLE